VDELRAPHVASVVRSPAVKTLSVVCFVALIAATAGCGRKKPESPSAQPDTVVGAGAATNKR
jgi:predicted small lipoprotein YifL